MFDYTKANETLEAMSIKTQEVVDTAMTTAEENTKKMNSYIQDQSVRTVADSYAEASFAIARAIIDANKNLSDNVNKILTR